ncbi:hypothetical protein N0V88_004341 [Collariella sp. IMI 366227]|nr:hypothetical protein N0V88_004341 [Collariella sp. IMI 366227]
MDYTRYSSQPATIDLVRADLAEVWPIDHPGVENPQKPPSVSGFSDMLDLEFIQTPGFRPSKGKKKDPLPDLLSGILDQTPSRKGRNDSQGHEPTSTPSPAASDDVAQAYGFDSPSVSDHKPPKKGKSEHPSHLDKPQAKANGHDRTSDSSAVNTRRPRQMTGKTAPASKTKKGPGSQPKQIKISPGFVKPASTKAKRKAKNRADDLFELSDATDSEAESKPRKRQAKDTLPKKPSETSSQKPQAPGKTGNLTVGKKGKRSRVLKTPARCADHHHAPETRKSTGHQATVKAAVTDNQQEEPGVEVAQGLVLKEPRVSEAPLKNHSRVDGPAEDDRRKTIRPEPVVLKPAKKPAVELRQKEPVLPKWPEHQDVISISSDDAEVNIAPESTSPLFMEQNQKHPIVSDSPSLTVTVQPGANIDQPLPVRLPVEDRCGFTPPPSFQPRALPNLTETPQTRGMRSETAITGANLFSEEHSESSSSAPLAVNPSSDDSSTPEDVWKQAVENDNPPAVLSRIVNPREEVVRDIANDYQENALRLLDGLATRHEQEKADTLVTLHDFKRPVLAQKIDELTRLSLAGSGRYDLGRLDDDSVSEPEEADETLDGLVETYKRKLLQAIHRVDEQGAEVDDGIGLRVDEFIKRCLQGDTKTTHRSEARRPERPAHNADEGLEGFLDKVLNGLHGTGEGHTVNHAVPKKSFAVAHDDIDMADFVF